MQFAFHRPGQGRHVVNTKIDSLPADWSLTRLRLIPTAWTPGRSMSPSHRENVNGEAMVFACWLGLGLVSGFL